VCAAPQEFKGYVFKILGGQDKQGFPMKQGVLVPGRVQVLMSPGDSCFRGFGRRNGERRRKSVRGCIVSPDLSVLNLVIVKKGAPARSLVQGQYLHSSACQVAWCITAELSTVSSRCCERRGELTASTRQHKRGCKHVAGCSSAWAALATARRPV